MQTKIKLKIADIIIQMQSRFNLKQLTKEEKMQQAAERFKNFLYKGKHNPDIKINVNIVGKLPKVTKAKPVFVTYHFQNGEENWRLLVTKTGYVYKCSLEGREQLALINQNFNQATAYLWRRKGKEMAWGVGELIYDFLQVLLINYAALRRKGVFTHGMGVRDSDGSGLLFAGKSGTGKSTMARLWHNHSRAMVLNDDRIIIRRQEGRFVIHGSPWHGDFNDYLVSRIESAPIKRLFFIRHCSHNSVKRVSQKEAFHLLYPTIFPTFWDKGSLENIASFCQELVQSVPCYSLGFVKDKQVIQFVRKIA